MSLVFLILIPLLAGILSFLWKGGSVRTLALFSSIATLVVSAVVACDSMEGSLAFRTSWIPLLGSEFSLYADGMGATLCLLTGIVMPVIFLSMWDRNPERPHAFFGLMLLSQAGITGVFLAHDLLLFYVFWELALIPVYFLCSQWGGPRRIPVTFKFFVYTFAGSLIMLAGVIYLASLNPGTFSYSWENVAYAGKRLNPEIQGVVFWILFLAFAIKMPVFPFHTWQPDTYEQSPTPVTIVLSALMVKMGLFAVLRWLLPVVPVGAAYWSDTIMVLCVTGIIYASCLAMIQTDLKRLVAYSSIAHMGLMCAAAFAGTAVGIHGLMVQMFNHGISITGMWLMVSMIENRYGTRDMSRLGGMAIVAPHMAIGLLIISFANIGLPLTNGFIGEFMLFHGIFQSASSYHIVFMVLAGTGIILGAVYMLGMLQKTAFGNTVPMQSMKDMSLQESIAMAVILALVLFLGVYPKPLLLMTETAARVLIP